MHMILWLVFWGLIIKDSTNIKIDPSVFYSIKIRLF